MPYEKLPFASMLPVLEMIILLALPPVFMPSKLFPVVFSTISRLAVSEPLITLAAIAAAVAPSVVPTPFVLPILLVVKKSVAITGVDRARQTKADVPSKPTLRDFKLIVLTVSVGRTASVLG